MSGIRDMLLRIMGVVQGSLFPAVEERLGDNLTEREQKLVEVLAWVEIDKHLPDLWGMPGRPPCDRVNLAKAFVAKAVYNIPETKMLLSQLHADPHLRTLSGWARAATIPSESTFSRAFAEFAASALPTRVHQALIAKTQSERIVGHASIDSSAIEAREHPQPKAPAALKPAKPKGRPHKGEQRPPERNVLDIQREQTLQEILSALPSACGIGAKKNSKGYVETWIGYKIHIITGEGGIPLVCLLTSAWVHDSQVAIPLLNLLDGTVTCLYVLMDAAYDAAAIWEYCRSLGYVPIIDINPRNNQALAQMLRQESKAMQFLHIEPPEHVHYRERSASERVNSRLKDEFGGRYVRVRGHAKVMAHLMFGILALTVDQIVRLVQ